VYAFGFAAFSEALQSSVSAVRYFPDVKHTDIFEKTACLHQHKFTTVKLVDEKFQFCNA